jgi:hypothetical protein
MKRKSILTLLLTLLILVSISIIGCGNNKTANKGSTGNNFFNSGVRGRTEDSNVAEGANGNITDGTTTGGTAQGNTNNSIDTGNDTTKNAADATKNRIEAAGNSIKYGAPNFIDDIRNAGYDVKESIDNRSKYFTGNETDYTLGGDVVRVYEYNSAADLEKDINRISPDGLTINGTNANYKTKPYYYRRGNSLIVYEGNEPAFIDEFRNIYGNPLR